MQWSLEAAGWGPTGSNMDHLHFCLQQPQIILLKEGTDTSQGTPQLVSNINACMALADTVRTTLGPRGMDKLIHDDKVSMLPRQIPSFLTMLLLMFFLGSPPTVNIWCTAVSFPGSWQCVGGSDGGKDSCLGVGSAGPAAVAGAGSDWAGVDGAFIDHSLLLTDFASLFCTTVLLQGHVTISNDGATIMKLLDVVHPAAKTLVDVSLSQDAEVRTALQLSGRQSAGSTYPTARHYSSSCCTVMSVAGLRRVRVLQ